MLGDCEHSSSLARRLASSVRRQLRPAAPGRTLPHQLRAHLPRCSTIRISAVPYGYLPARPLRVPTLRRERLPRAHPRTALHALQITLTSRRVITHNIHHRASAHCAIMAALLLVMREWYRSRARMMAGTRPRASRVPASTYLYIHYTLLVCTFRTTVHDKLSRHAIIIDNSVP